MKVLWVDIAVFRKIFLAVLFCCALFGIGVGNLAVNNFPSQFTMALFAQNSVETQPESPLEEPLESAAAQPESPLAEPESRSEEAALSQPESPLKEPEPIATEEPTAVPSKTPEPTPTFTAEPTVVPTPIAIFTVEPTTIAESIETGVITGTTLLTSTMNLSTTQAAIITQTAQSESIQTESFQTESTKVEGEQRFTQVVIEPTGSQALTAAPGAVTELLGLLVSTGTRPLFLTENLILALLCLIGFSVMWLGLCALSVCLFYIRSRQPSQINDYAHSDRQMIVHYRR